MTTRSWRLTLGILILPVFCFANLESELKHVYETHLNNLQKKDLKGAMSSIHPKSPIFKTTEDFYQSINKSYELKYVVVAFSLVGGDDEYKIARIRQKSTKVRGPDFRDNMVDTFQVFKQDKKDWKLWQVMTLDIQFLKAAVSKKNTKKKAK